MATTANDIVASVRLHEGLVRQLDELATEMDRSRSYLIAQAVREFVEREYVRLAAIREGEADIAAGHIVAHEKISAWLEDLAAGRHPKPPVSR